MQNQVEVFHGHEVALIDGRPISAQALLAAWNANRGTLRDGAEKIAVLDSLVKKEVIYSRAQAEGFVQTPEMQARIKQLIVGQYTERFLNLEPTEVSDEEVGAYYLAHQKDYTEPARARAAVIFFKADSRLSEEQRSARRQRALAALEAARHGEDAQTFAKLARLHSDDQSTRYRGGDLGWIPEEKSGWDPLLVRALYSIDEIGGLAPLIETKEGLFLVKLLDKRPEGVKPLAEVLPVIRHQLARSQTDRARQSRFEALKAKADIRINQALLDSLTLPRNDRTLPMAPGMAAARL